MTGWRTIILRRSRLRRPGLERPQPRLRAVEVLLRLAAADADRAQHRLLAAHQRRTEARDDGDAAHLGHRGEERGTLLGHLRERPAIPMPERRAARLALRDLGRERRSPI